MFSRNKFAFTSKFNSDFEIIAHYNLAIWKEEVLFTIITPCILNIAEMLAGAFRCRFTGKHFSSGPGVTWPPQCSNAPRKLIEL